MTIKNTEQSYTNNSDEKNRTKDSLARQEHILWIYVVSGIWSLLPRKCTTPGKRRSWTRKCDGSCQIRKAIYRCQHCHLLEVSCNAYVKTFYFEMSKNRCRNTEKWILINEKCYRFCKNCGIEGFSALGRFLTPFPGKGFRDMTHGVIRKIILPS